jgi:aryl-alcohol dehydrogenase-like predicted oxidoreductase
MMRTYGRRYCTAKVNRRGFVRDISLRFAGASLFAGSPLLPFATIAENKMVYRRLGRTGFQVSEIGLGGHYDGPNWKTKNSRDQQLRDAVFAECVKGGINCFDTNADYERKSLAISIKTLPDIRDKILVVADINDKDGTKDDTYKFILDSVEEQLRFLQLPFVDVMRFTAVIRKTPLEKCEAAIKAFQEVKKAGKAKYLAFSQHDPDLLMQWIQRYDEIDIIYVPYNYFANKADQELFPAARKRDIGIIVIKPFNKGTIFDPKLTSLMEGGGVRSVIELAEKQKQSRTPEDLTRGTNLTLAQVSLRFILSNPNISTVIPGMETVAEVRENLAMAGRGSEFGKSDRAMLDSYARHLDECLPPAYQWLKGWKQA